MNRIEIEKIAKELLENEIRYRELFEKTNTCVAVYEAIENGEDFIIKDINKATEKTESVKKEDLIGKKVSEVFPGVKKLGLFEIFKRVWKTGVSENHPESYYEDEKRSGWRKNYVYKSSHEEIVAVYEDITERKKSEVQLKEDKERINLTEAVTSSGTFDWNISTDKTVWSEGLYNLFGVNKYEKVSFELWKKLLHPDDAKSCVENLAQIIENKKDVANLYRVIRPDNKKIVWIESHGKTFYENGKPKRMIGICMDVTESKKAEEGIRESEEKFQTLVESSIDFIWEMDQNGAYTYCSPQSKELWGFEPNDLIGKTPFGNMKPEEREKAIETFKVLSKSPGPVRNMEVRSIDIQGNDILLEISFVPFWDNDKKLGGYRGISRDITKRKRAEDALRESEEKHKSLVESIDSAVSIVDETGHFHYMNEIAARMLGSSPEKLIGKTMHDLFPEQIANSQLTSVKKVISTGEGSIVENLSMVAGGKIWFRTSVQPLKDNSGKITKAIVNAFDITERKKSEEIIKKSLEEKGALLKEISHRIKNNLQIISSLLSIQINSVGKEEYRQLMKSCQTRIKSISLIHEKLSPSENVKEIHCANYIRTLTEHLFHFFDVDRNKINYQINVGEDIALNVESAIPCSLIINELVSNSLKHAFPQGRNGEIKVEMKKVYGDKIMLTVQDNGIGIPEQSGFNETKSLGLQLVNTLIAQLDGTIELDKTHGAKYIIIFKHQMPIA